MSLTSSSQRVTASFSILDIKLSSEISNTHYISNYLRPRFSFNNSLAMLASNSNTLFKSHGIHLPNNRIKSFLYCSSKSSSNLFITQPNSKMLFSIPHKNSNERELISFIFTNNSILKPNLNSSIHFLKNPTRISCASNYNSRSEGNYTRGRKTGQYKSQSFNKRGKRRDDDQRRKKNSNELPPGAFWMEDPETKEKIFVWGVEGSPPKLTAEDLKWEPAKIIGSGEISDDQLWRLMEGEKYLPQEYDYDDFEQEPAEDYVDVRRNASDFRLERIRDESIDESIVELENELEKNQNEEREEEEEEEEKVVLRKRKLKIFGKDFKGKGIRNSSSSSAEAMDEAESSSQLDFAKDKISNLDKLDEGFYKNGQSDSNSASIFKGVEEFEDNDKKIKQNQSASKRKGNFFKNFETKFAEEQNNELHINENEKSNFDEIKTSFIANEYRSDSEDSRQNIVEGKKKVDDFTLSNDVESKTSKSDEYVSENMHKNNNHLENEHSSSSSSSNSTMNEDDNDEFFDFDDDDDDDKEQEGKEKAKERKKDSFKSLYLESAMEKSIKKDAKTVNENVNDFHVDSPPYKMKESMKQKIDYGEERKIGVNFQSKRFMDDMQKTAYDNDDDDDDDDFEGIIEIDDEWSNKEKTQSQSQTNVRVKSTLLDALREKSLRGKVNESQKVTFKSSDYNLDEIDEIDEMDVKKKVLAKSTIESQSQKSQKYIKIEINREERENYDESLVDQFFSAKSFHQIDANEQTIRTLQSISILRPSHIQAMSFKPILNGRSCIMADQTGTGKTLAYLTPLFQKLKQQETEAKGEGEGEGEGGANGVQMAPPNRPYVLILTPTAELAVQVSQVCKLLSRGGMPLRSLIVTGGHGWKTQVKSLTTGCEILISTPGRVFQHLKSGTLVLDQVQSVVIDEADIMFDQQEFYDMIQHVKKSVPLGSTQFVHVTATLPEDVHEKLTQQYSNSITLIGPSLHRTSSGLTQFLVDCSTGDDEERTEETAFVKKRSELIKILENNDSKKTIIFCNKIETCRKVENALQRYDRNENKFKVIPYHAALTQEARQTNMKQFMEWKKSSQRLILLCTDRASRGVDSLDVGLVILFDFPRDPSEYVRRVGRTARGAGGTGSVYVFALGKQMGIAHRIMLRNERGLPVHNIPGSQY